jgi:hypothetical protein
MFAKTLTFAAAAALSVAALVPTAAEARHYRGGDGYSRHYDGGNYRGEGRRYYRGDRYYGNRGYNRGYYAGNGYYGGRGYYRGRCRDSGTGGTIIGAIAGGLLGHEVAQGRYNRGDGTAGAVVGAGIGALAGRAIDRDC